MNHKFDELAKGMAQSVTRRAESWRFGRGRTSGSSVQTLPGFAWGQHRDRPSNGGEEMSSVASDQHSFGGLARNLQKGQVIHVRRHFVRPGFGDDCVLVSQLGQEGFAALPRNGEMRPRQY